MKKSLKELLGDARYEELKKFVFGAETETETETEEFETDDEDKDKKNYAKATLEDGTVIQWEGELAEGTAIEVVPEEGEPIPAPDGEHMVSDGTIVVTDNGIVTEIRTGTEDEGNEEAERLLEEIQNSFAAYKSETDAKIEQLQSRIQEQEQFNKDLFESLEHLAKREEMQEEKKDKFNAAAETKRSLSNNAAKISERLKQGWKTKN